MYTDEINEKLKALAEDGYREFSLKIVPSPDPILGVRAPKLKALSAEIFKSGHAMEFLREIQPEFIEQKFLIIGVTARMNLPAAERAGFADNFIPLVHDWAVSDSLSGSLNVNSEEDKLIFIKYIEKWLLGGPWAQRLAATVLMEYYLDDVYIDFSLNKLKSIASPEYYVNMGVAWAVSVALVKQYGKAVKLIENKELPVWVHNKSIQKAVESFRIMPERKNYLKSLKIKA